MFEKDQKLAIQMWEEIREQLPEWHKQADEQNFHGESVGSKIKRFQGHFLVVRNIYWTNNDWLCDYYHSDCSKCPLKSCNAGDTFTAWYHISRGWEPLQARLKACDKVIEAIKSVKEGF